MPGIIPIVGDMLESRSCQYTNNQIALNVLHWKVTGVTSGGLTLASIAAQFDTNWFFSYKLWMSPDSSWRGVGVRNLTAPRTTEFASIAHDGVGTGGGQNLPTQTSGVLSTFTGLGGRKGHGRFYPGFPASTYADAQGEQNAAGSLQLAQIAAVINVSEVLSVGPTSTTVQMVVRNKDLPGPPPVPQGTDVRSIITRLIFGTQRRRGQYGRPNALPF